MNERACPVDKYQNILTKSKPYHFHYLNISNYTVNATHQRFTVCFLIRNRINVEIKYREYEMNSRWSIDFARFSRLTVDKRRAIVLRTRLTFCSLFFLPFFLNFDRTFYFIDTKMQKSSFIWFLLTKTASNRI